MYFYKSQLNILLKIWRGDIRHWLISECVSTGVSRTKMIDAFLLCSLLRSVIVLRTSCFFSDTFFRSHQNCHLVFATDKFVRKINISYCIFYITAPSLMVTVIVKSHPATFCPSFWLSQVSSEKQDLSNTSFFWREPCIFTRASSTSSSKSEEATFGTD